MEDIVEIEMNGGRTTIPRRTLEFWQDRGWSLVEPVAAEPDAPVAEPRQAPPPPTKPARKSTRRR